MTKARVPLYKTPGKSVVIDTDGTGATLGKNLYNSNGNLLTLSELKSLLGVGGSQSVEVSGSLGSTDDLKEGVYNLYFTTQRVLTVMNATDGALARLDSVDLSTGEVTNKIAANLEYGVVGSGVSIESLKPATINADNTDTEIQAVASDSSNVSLVFDAVAKTLTPDLLPTAVVAGTYGGASSVPQISVDSNGRVTKVLAVASGAAAQLVPTYTDVDFTVPVNTQMLWAAPIDLGANADLIIDGDLVGVS